MLCQKCNNYREDKTNDCISLIYGLIRLTEAQENNRAKMLRMTMLQRNILKQYKILDDLNALLLSRCEDCDRLN